jgi:hypothetical protein
MRFEKLEESDRRKSCYSMIIDDPPRPCPEPATWKSTVTGMIYCDKHKEYIEGKKWVNKH